MPWATITSAPAASAALASATVVALANHFMPLALRRSTIPLLVVSKYSEGGHVAHEYSDHASVVKFIERNWELKPLTHRSRDNLPNPVMSESSPYVPLDPKTGKPGAAVGDLFDMFDFKNKGDDKD